MRKEYFAIKKTIMQNKQSLFAAIGFKEFFKNEFMNTFFLKNYYFEVL
jgi:hypothetical protein